MATDDRLTTVPNLLTLARIVILVPICLCLYFQTWRWLAFSLYGVAALTDFLDGYLARRWSLQSDLGRMLDPIADKLLVTALLLTLVATGEIAGLSLLAVQAILLREILISGVREHLAGQRIVLPVTFLAKLKTTSQMLALGALIPGPALPGATITGLVLLWLAALLTWITAADYLRSCLRYMAQGQQRPEGTAP